VSAAREASLRALTEPARGMHTQGLDRESAIACSADPPPHGGVRAMAIVDEAAGNPLALLELSGALRRSACGRAPMPQALHLTARLHSAFLHASSAYRRDASRAVGGGRRRSPASSRHPTRCRRSHSQKTHSCRRRRRGS
jgi:hypothetical protein